MTCDLSRFLGGLGGRLRRTLLGEEELFLSSYGGPGRVTLQTLGHAPKPGAGTKAKH